jgi:type IV secretion system protein TrbH
MVKWSFAFVLLSLLTGCVTTPYYGNYVDKDSAMVNQVIAKDAVTQLTQLYRPASTRFNLQHATEDPFGVTFIENLRAGGYAISEQIKTNPLKTATATPAASAEGAALAYVLDQTRDVYRLSVMVDDQILTRAYKPYKDSIYPAGAWVRKE